MREPRNPFLLRAAEHIESDTTFLGLFSPGVLEVLASGVRWDRIQIFRSAPGGGKTSLFRLFTPMSLQTLYALRAAEDFRELYQRLEALGVFSVGGPTVLGVMHSCATRYAALDDLLIEPLSKQRLFFSLLNARLTLAALRSILAFARLSFPGDLERIEITPQVSLELPRSMPGKGTGRDYYEWARALEQAVCERLDSFEGNSIRSLEGHDGLHVLSLLQADSIKVLGSRPAPRILLLLDDLHRLTSAQRVHFLSTLFGLRPAIGVWIAERLEALEPDELLGTGATAGREHGEPIALEDFWRSERNSKRFENALVSIADRRARSVRDVSIGSYTECLADSLDGAEWERKFSEAVRVVADRVKLKADVTRGHFDLIASREAYSGTARQRALEWRTVEIQLERDLRKPQQLPLTPDLFPVREDLLKKDPSSVRAAAEFLLAQEFGFPYYFGMGRLASLASSNIEQFLALAGDLFEEIVSSALLKRPTILSPERQQEILGDFAVRRWNDIPRRVPRGRDVQKFLEAVHQCARWETDRPTAPYAPGVTGIGITMQDRDRLLDPDERRRQPLFERLLRAISAAISHNLLEASLDVSQGQRGKTWMILYLNRWLCLHFRLPLHYGGWRGKGLGELAIWLEQGFRPPDEPSEKLLLT